MSHFTRRQFCMRGSAAAAAIANLPCGALEIPSEPGAFSAQSAGPALGWPYATVQAAAQAIRRKEVSSVELTRLMLDRIERFNPRLKAISTVTADLALEQARRADMERDRATAGEMPLLGVPCTVKDTFETAGVRTTAGVPFLKDHVPARDAEAVARLRAGGMVLLGMTNVPPMAGDWQSANPLFGTSNNPWDLRRTPGGSTGGGAAALAAGIGYFALGSDLAGSIRVPAHFCGVFGHKPTLGIVPQRGHIPPLPGAVVGRPNGLAVAGPLARSANDLLLALRVLGDFPAPLVPRKKSIRDYRIGFMLDHPLCPVSSDVKERLSLGVQALRRAGATLVEGFPTDLDVATQYRDYLFLFGTVIARSLEPQHAKFFRTTKHAPDAYYARALQLALEGDRDRWIAAEQRRKAARALWQAYFREFDAFLLPTDFVAAFAHDNGTDQFRRTLQTAEGHRDYMDQMFWISFASLSGMPATVAPVGRTKAGLPVGAQIIGPWMEDATSIFVTSALEAEFGFVPPDLA